MRVKTLLALAGVCLGLGWAAGAASAQIVPIPVDVYVCNSTRFDFNNDGKFGKSDLYLFMNRMREANCEDSPAGSEGCAEFDLNGDGVVNLNDMMFAYDHLVSCVFPPVSGVLPQPEKPR